MPKRFSPDTSTTSTTSTSSTSGKRHRTAPREDEDEDPFVVRFGLENDDGKFSVGPTGIRRRHCVTKKMIGNHMLAKVSRVMQWHFRSGRENVDYAELLKKFTTSWENMCSDALRLVSARAADLVNMPKRRVNVPKKHRIFVPLHGEARAAYLRTFDAAVDEERQKFGQTVSNTLTLAYTSIVPTTWHILNLQRCRERVERRGTYVAEPVTDQMIETADPEGTLRLIRKEKAEMAEMLRSMREIQEGIRVIDHNERDAQTAGGV